MFPERVTDDFCGRMLRILHCRPSVRQIFLEVVRHEPVLSSTIPACLVGITSATVLPQLDGCGIHERFCGRWPLSYLNRISPRYLQI